MRQEELTEILSQAGPRGKELATALARRSSFELHIHITGPVLIGSEIARTLGYSIVNNKGKDKE